MQSVLYGIWLVVVVLLLGLPAILMILRAVRPRWMPIGALLAALVIGGWVLANAQVHVRQMYLGHIVRSMPEPRMDDPIVMEWSADGAKMIVAAFLGWLYGPLLWVLWSPVFGVVVVVRRVRGVLGGRGDARSNPTV